MKKMVKRIVAVCVVLVLTGCCVQPVEYGAYEQPYGSGPQYRTTVDPAAAAFVVGAAIIGTAAIINHNRHHHHHHHHYRYYR